MSDTDPIEATRDLVGAFSLLLDEFAAAWGGLRIANDQLRTHVLLEAIDGPAARADLASWIESRVDTDQRALIAPLIALLWTSGDTTPGAIHAFEARLDPGAPVGVRHLHELVATSFEAYHRAQPGVGNADGRSPRQHLANAASDEHRFALPDDDLQAIAAAGAGSLNLALNRWERDPRVGEADVTQARRSRGWWSLAVVGHAELVALPGLTISHLALTPAVPPEHRAVLGLLVEASDRLPTRELLGPALVTVWDSFGHTFGLDTGDPEPESDPDLDDPFREAADFGDRVGSEAANLLGEGSWFPGILEAREGPPRLSGGVRTLLAPAPTLAPSVTADPHVEAIVADAKSDLERLAANLSPERLTPFAAKSAALRATGTGDAVRTTDYVARVVDALAGVAIQAGSFAEHLDAGAEGEPAPTLEIALRLAAIVNWLDAVGCWTVSDAVSSPEDDRPARTASPPPGYRTPSAVIEELAASLPAGYAVDEYRLVVEQRGVQWDEIAVLDNAGPPDFAADWSAVVDIEGFAER